MNQICTNNLTVACRSLEELWLHVIYKCNLNCRHCLFNCSPADDGPGNLTLDKCREYVSLAEKQGLKAVYITGGEPLLWPELRDFLAWYYSREVVLPLTILTNGTLIDRDTADYFSKYASQGLNLRISLECYTRETNDDYRGDGSFTRAAAGIRNLNDCGIRPWIAYVNKSGGTLDCSGSQQLEADFKTRLGQDHGLEIAGLKIIAAYSKGRFAGSVNHESCSEKVIERITTVQCNYGVAVSKSGTYPCPILVDVPDAKLNIGLDDIIGSSFSLNYNFCASCFATGTRCGQ